MARKVKRPAKAKAKPRPKAKVPAKAKPSRRAKKVAVVPEPSRPTTVAEGEAERAQSHEARTFPSVHESAPVPTVIANEEISYIRERPDGRKTTTLGHILE